MNTHRCLNDGVGMVFGAGGSGTAAESAHVGDGCAPGVVADAAGCADDAGSCMCITLPTEEYVG